MGSEQTIVEVFRELATPDCDGLINLEHVEPLLSLIDTQAAENTQLKEVVCRIQVICGIGIGTPLPNAVGKICDLLTELKHPAAQSPAQETEAHA